MHRVSPPGGASSWHAGAAADRPLLPFFALVFALSVPFWVAGFLTDRRLLEGLPVSALMAVCPLIAASTLVYRRAGLPGLAALLARAFDAKRVSPRIWYIPIVLLMPAVTAASYALAAMMGVALPAQRVSAAFVLILAAAFFVSGLTEEVGWTGYATDPLQARSTALGAGLLLGTIWAAWHAVPLVQAQRPPAWIAWWALGTVASRVLIVWLYTAGGRSVFAAIVFHAMSNVSLYAVPNYVPLYDPRITGLILAALAAVVAAPWGPRLFARLAPARPGSAKGP